MGECAEGGSLAVFGLGPVGQLAVRSAKHLGIERVFAIDLVPERLALAQQWGAEVIDTSAVRRRRRHPQGDDRRPRPGLGPRRGRYGGARQPGRRAGHRPASRLPKPVAKAAIERVGIDRLSALHTAIEAVRRGGTLSISRVYGGSADPMPLMTMFDKA